MLHSSPQDFYAWAADFHQSLRGPRCHYLTVLEAHIHTRKIELPKRFWWNWPKILSTCSLALRQNSEFCSLLGSIISFIFSAQILLDSLCAKDECIREAVATCEQAANEGRFRLRDLLAVPMQRVLKYHLLLKELVNQTRKFLRAVLKATQGCC